MHASFEDFSCFLQMEENILQMQKRRQLKLGTNRAMLSKYIALSKFLPVGLEVYLQQLSLFLKKVGMFMVWDVYVSLSSLNKFEASMFLAF